MGEQVFNQITPHVNDNINNGNVNKNKVIDKIDCNVASKSKDNKNVNNSDRLIGKINSYYGEIIEKIKNRKKNEN